MLLCGNRISPGRRGLSMQQVNLYLPEFRPRRNPLNLAQVLGILLAGALLVALVTFWGAQTNVKLERQLQAERERLAQLTEEVEALRAQASRNNQMSMEERRARLRADVTRRERILQLIERQNLGNAEGFSAQLEALARQSREGLALAEFYLKQGGNYMEMRGRVASAQRLPEYLQRLRQEPSFAQVGFGVIDLARESDGHGPGLEFSLLRADKERDRED